MNQPTYWLKLLGMGLRGKPLDDDWMTTHGGILDRAVMFSREPSIKKGDAIVFYAAGKRVIFAIAEATSFPYQNSEVDQNWPWLVNIRYWHKRSFLHDGIPLSVMNVDRRDIAKSIRQKGHIKLTKAEYEAAARALELAVEEDAQGLSRTEAPTTRALETERTR